MSDGKAIASRGTRASEEMVTGRQKDEGVWRNLVKASRSSGETDRFKGGGKSVDGTIYRVIMGIRTCDTGLHCDIQHSTAARFVIVSFFPI